MTIGRDLELITTDEEHDGLTHIGVMVDGAFVPIAAVKTGSLEQRKNVPTALSVAAEAEAKKSSRAKKSAETPDEE
jgi:hypothetical protein